MLLLMATILIVWACIATVFMAACISAARGDRAATGRRYSMRLVSARRGTTAGRRRTSSLA